MIGKLNINLENCYGIRKLNTELLFKHRGVAIYAPNGVMKTSFAKTMLDLSKGKKPKDLAFPDRDTTCEILLDDTQINPEEIFVIKSYDKDYSPEGVSTLLANEGLKKRYEEVHKDIGDAKKTLDKKLLSLSGFGERSRENIELIIERIFGGHYYDILLSLEADLDEIQDKTFGEADYKIIFNPKVLQLLSDTVAKETIEEFAIKYDELTESSPILRKEFQYHNVNQVQQHLESNNFFNAGHSINLSDKEGGEKTEFTTNESLLEKIEAEKLRVLSDTTLKKKFEVFNSKLKNKDLQVFRDYITQNQYLLPELQDMDVFERNLWLQYLHKAREEYNVFINKYKSGKAELVSIVSEAHADTNDWDYVIKEFNQRFLHLPFQLSVENKSDVILKDTTPSIEFNFIDGDDQRIYAATQRDDLLRILSTGEERALYILNIMFEVHTKWKVRKKTLFVFDDIADSFDYKNKFAIIDYLDHIIKAEDTNFLAIILTHNFDFLRTIEGREICPAHQCYMAFKKQDHITLSKFQNRSDIRNPFHKWRARLTEAEIQIAYIPFLRNVIEYTQGMKDEEGNYNADYLTLTKMLHYKNDTENLKIKDYKEVFERHFTNQTFPVVDLEKGILDYIIDTSNNCLDQDDGINLEHKIVLSIAIRICAEKYIIEKIRNDYPDYDSEKKQMGNLLQDFKDRFNNLTEDIRLLKRINLITPSNIHINAFMYEPILDMGFGELKALYQEIRDNLVN